jgi:hypothetical protein
MYFILMQMTMRGIRLCIYMQSTLLLFKWHLQFVCLEVHLTPILWQCTLHLCIKRCICHTLNYSANGTRYSNVQMALMYGKCAHGTHYVNFCANSTCIQGSSIFYYVECIYTIYLCYNIKVKDKTCKYSKVYLQFLHVPVVRSILNDGKSWWRAT